MLDLEVFWNLVGRSEYMPPLYRLEARFPQATSLNLRYCNQLKDCDLKTLLENHVDSKKILEIDLFYCFSITSQGIAYAVELCPDLRRIVLNFCVGIDNKCIVHLSNLRHLEVIEMVKPV